MTCREAASDDPAEIDARRLQQSEQQSQREGDARQSERGRCETVTESKTVSESDITERSNYTARATSQSESDIGERRDITE